MFKLVAVGGKIRGTEYVLKEGANIIGRDESADIVFNESGVSKNHVKITVNGETIFLEDMGSANGTFVNNKLVKLQTLVADDLIALPNIILKLIHVKEKKIIIHKKTFKEIDEEPEDIYHDEAKPSHIPGKIMYFFKRKFMNFFHGQNEEYEWRSIFITMLVIFILISVALTIYPVLEDSKKILLSEAIARGTSYARFIDRVNKAALSEKDLDSIDTSILDKEEGLASYELFDLEGRIVRPLSKINKYIQDTFSTEALNYFKSNYGSRNDLYAKFLDKGEIGISKTIKAWNQRTGLEEEVGIIAIRFAPKSLILEATHNSKAYLESIITSTLLAILFFGIIYYLTLRHIDEIRFQIDSTLRGRRKELEPKAKMIELDSLRKSINSLLSRLRELEGTEQGSGFDEVEEDTKYVETLTQILEGAQGPAIVLNSQKLIKHLNVYTEDLIGIRESSSTDMSLLDVAREKGFAATVNDLCDQSANMQGKTEKGEYELQGDTYKIFVTSLIGKDGFAKAFYVSFVKEK